MYTRVVDTHAHMIRVSINILPFCVLPFHPLWSTEGRAPKGTEWVGGGAGGNRAEKDKQGENERIVLIENTNCKILIKLNKKSITFS